MCTNQTNRSAWSPNFKLIETSINTKQIWLSLQEAYFLIWGCDVAMPLTWDQALFSFHLTNKFLVRKVKRERARENVWILAAKTAPDLRLPYPKFANNNIYYRYDSFSKEG